MPKTYTYSISEEYANVNDYYYQLSTGFLISTAIDEWLRMLTYLSIHLVVNLTIK